MRKPIVVSLYAGPGAGKSTLAAYTFSKLKMLGVNCELVTEFAKDKVWEKNNTALDNQIYIFAKQQYRIARCADKVDVIVTDSPLFLSAFYNSDPDIDAPLRQLVYKISQKYEGLDYFVRRVKKYNPMGRLQTEEEAKQYDDNIKQMLDQFGVSYKEIDGDLMSADIIIQDVQEALSAKNTNLNMYN